jgi:hypothetical protein
MGYETLPTDDPATDTAGNYDTPARTPGSSGTIP